MLKHVAEKDSVQMTLGINQRLLSKELVFMVKRSVAFIIVIALVAAFTPMVSRAAVIPYFMAVNDTLLPFSDDNMPFVSGGVIFVSPSVFKYADVESIASEDLEQVRLYRGDQGRHVDFYTSSGVTQDNYQNTLGWPAARRIGSRFYVPLVQVCDFFALTWEIFEIDRSIIPQEQMRLIWIQSEAGVPGQTFIGLNRNAIRNAYNSYHAPPSPPPSPQPTAPGVDDTPPPPEEEPPDYSDITLLISFNDISAGGADMLFKLLDTVAEFDYKFCFFVSVDDICEDPGVIRRIAGSGHTIGIWLESGSYEEYAEISALLFEAAKVKTIVVSAAEASGSAIATADRHGLIFWGATQSLVYDDTLSVEEVIDMIPKESGARQNIMSSCSENAALMLSGILSYLRENEFMVVGITETIEPTGIVG